MTRFIITLSRDDMENIMPPNRLGLLVEKNKQLATALMCLLCDHASFASYLKQVRSSFRTMLIFIALYFLLSHTLQLLVIPMSLPVIETTCTLTQRVQLPAVFVEKSVEIALVFIL